MRFHGRMPRKGRFMMASLCAAGVLVACLEFAAGTPLRVAAASPAVALQRAAEAQRDAVVPRFGVDRRVAAASPQAAAASALAHQPALRPTTPETARAVIIKILTTAARRHQLDPHLVLALAFWESGWDQSRVSSTGAVGLMQVEPQTAAEAGPALLGHPVDVQDPRDNADVGAAILRQNLDTFHDQTLALAAYYEGPNALRANGLQPDAQQYADGILAIAARMPVAS
jgi:soluble lytic murein transglycosylase-like protein